MFKRLRRQTLHLWIALLAVLFSALAPTISHAMAGSPSAVLAEICTTDGLKATASHGSGSDSNVHGMEHCPYCATHGSLPALPPILGSGFAIIGGHDLYPSLFYHAPQPLTVWRAASPRGPPIHS